MFCLSPMLTKKKMPIEGTQKKMRKESKHITTHTKRKKNQWNRKEDSKKGKEWQKSCKTNRKQLTNDNNKSFPVNYYFRCKWIKLLHQKTEWLNEWKKNKIQLHSVYKRLTSDLKTHRGWKWKFGKRHTMQIVSESKGGHTYIIQNRLCQKFEQGIKIPSENTWKFTTLL